MSEASDYSYYDTLNGEVRLARNADGAVSLILRDQFDDTVHHAKTFDRRFLVKPRDNNVSAISDALPDHSNQVTVENARVLHAVTDDAEEDFGRLSEHTFRNSHGTIAVLDCLERYPRGHATNNRDLRRGGTHRNATSAGKTLQNAMPFQCYQMLLRSGAIEAKLSRNISPRRRAPLLLQYLFKKSSDLSLSSR